MPSSNILLRAVALGLALAAAGCQSGSESGGGGFLGMGQPAKASQEDLARVTADELRAYCPRVTLPERAAIINRYTRDGEGDATKLQYRASIGDATRACTYGSGTLTLNVAAAGRIIPGPAGSLGNVSVPIVIRVVKGGEEIYRNVVQQNVTISTLSLPTQFLVNDPAITIPQPTAYDVSVFVGFDVPPEPARDSSGL